MKRGQTFPLSRPPQTCGMRAFTPATGPSEGLRSRGCASCLCCASCWRSQTARLTRMEIWCTWWCTPGALPGVITGFCVAGELCGSGCLMLLAPQQRGHPVPRAACMLGQTQPRSVFLELDVQVLQVCGVVCMLFTGMHVLMRHEVTGVAPTWLSDLWLLKCYAL